MYSVAKDVNESVATDDSADLLGRCASITNLSKFRASTFRLSLGVVTWPAVDLLGLRFKKSAP